jgi:hypothetical protein
MSDTADRLAQALRDLIKEAVQEAVDASLAPFIDSCLGLQSRRPLSAPTNRYGV